MGTGSLLAAVTAARLRSLSAATTIATTATHATTIPAIAPGYSAPVLVLGGSSLGERMAPTVEGTSSAGHEKDPPDLALDRSGSTFCTCACATANPSAASADVTASLTAVQPASETPAKLRGSRVRYSHGHANRSSPVRTRRTSCRAARIGTLCTAPGWSNSTTRNPTAGCRSTPPSRVDAPSVTRHRQ
jgi:hypothetical protein